MFEEKDLYTKAHAELPLGAVMLRTAIVFVLG